MDSIEFKKIIHEISQTSYALALRMLKNEEDAKDVLQEIIVKLWQKRFELIKIKNIQAYSYTLTKNHCLDLLKKHKTLSSDEENFNIELSNERTPEKQYESNTTKRLVHHLIQKLPDQQREVITMRDLEEWEFEEISITLKISVGTVRTNLSRARKFVKEELIKYYSNEERKVKAAHK